MALKERRMAVADEQNRVWKQMSDLIEGAATAGRDLTAEERQTYDAAEVDLERLGAEYDSLVKHEERAAQLAQPRREVRLLPGGRDEGRPAPSNPAREGQLTESDEYRDAFMAYIRSGRQEMNADQRSLLQRGYVAYAPTGPEARALTVTTTGGGYLIPEGFADTLTKARLQFGGMRQANTRKLDTDTGNDLPIPGMDDTGNKGVLLAINTQMATQDVAFTSLTLKAYVMHSKAVLVPWQLLQDSAFDVENVILAPAFGERIGRIENDYFTTGTGTDQPTGIVTAATIGLTGAASAANGPTYAELVALEAAVDPAYRMGAQFMCNDTSRGKLRLLLDGNNRPLWLPSQEGALSQAVPETVLGYPLIINQSMASPAANADSMIFGDLSYYWIRTVRGVQVIRLEERYADYLQTGFFAYSRVDGLLVDAGTHPVKKYRCAGS